MLTNRTYKTWQRDYPYYWYGATTIGEEDVDESSSSSVDEVSSSSSSEALGIGFMAIEDPINPFKVS